MRIHNWLKKYFYKVMDGNNRENMISFYNEINTLILPSDNEGFGLPIMEAMYFGNVVISKKTGTLYDIENHMGNYIKLDCIDNIHKNFDENFNKVSLCQLEEGIRILESLDQKHRKNMVIKAIESYYKYIKE